METGIREAKNSLSKLVEAVRNGQEVFITSRGQRVVQMIAAAPPPSPARGRGFLKDKIRLYPGWDSIEEDQRIADAFDADAE